MTPTEPTKRSFDTLRKFIRPPAPVEKCQLCAKPLPPEHRHLLDTTSRDLACSCDPCTFLFVGQVGAKFKPIPRDGRILSNFTMTDEQWAQLQTPIHLAFFVRRTDGRVDAFYPSPAGATASDLPLDAWNELATTNPILNELEPDVEALLVNRVRNTRDYFRAPIDVCYELVGLVRGHWRGLTGGAEVWAEIDRLTTRIKGRWHHA